MYGIPKAGKIDNDKMKLHMAKFVYEPAHVTSGFWRYQTFPPQFSMIVYDFGVKYDLQADITHLLDAQKNLQDIWGLVCQAIMWNKLRMGILQMGSAGINEKICDQSTEQI